jgi:hypothetical protein
LSTLTGWGCNSGGTLPVSGTNPKTYSGNLTVSTLGNNDVLTVDFNFTLTGDMTVNSNAHATINVPSGVTVTINGNFTDANNNVTFDVQTGGKLIINGTLTSNNNAVFTGGGTIQGTNLNLGSGASCTAPCPTVSFTNCTGDQASCNAVLPITLAWFKSDLDQGNVKLSWSTASELNFDYFSLQRSGDGTSFNEIAQVKGHGTTNEMHTYSYEDTNPIIGRSYYRLTSVDFDNYQETFKVILVDYKGEKKFHVSPNPSDGSTLSLSFNFANESDGQVIIYDNLGSIVGTYQVAGSNSVSIDNTLKSGVYLAKYSSSSFTKTERFLVK